MQWPWARTERRNGGRSPASRVHGGEPFDSALLGSTMQLPLVVESSPLRTPAQRWRGNGARSRTRREVRR